MNDEYWPKITPLMLRKGQRIEIDLVNHTMMAHPMHLHGHAFQVIAIGGRSIQGAVRDTVLGTNDGPGSALLSTPIIRGDGHSTVTTSIT